MVYCWALDLLLTAPGRRTEGEEESGLKERKKGSRGHYECRSVGGRGLR